MARVQELDVQLIAGTSFHRPRAVEWEQDSQATDPQALIEFAGRACYESFDKPNPRTASNEAYLRHILEIGHDALLEHATATLYIRGISRSVSHEFVRHRHFSFSQLSQRVAPPEDADVVLPALIAEDEQLQRLMLQAVDDANFVYDELMQAVEEKLADEPNALVRLKQARHAARAILPNATESRLVVTGNYRAWRHFITQCGAEHADTEMRAVAVACLRELKGQAPVLFDDFLVTTLEDGSQTATIPFV